MIKTLMPSVSQLVNAEYKSIRTVESERIINRALKGLFPVKNPELRQISGIPGAGKSTFCATHLPKNFLLLSFDNIMLQLNGYQNALKASGAEYAFTQYEMTARIIGYELLRRAIMLRLNIMFEHSGVNEAHIELFRNLVMRGYKTSVNYILCPTEKALQRSKERALIFNRFVPENLILERANKIKDYVMEYQKVASSVTFFDGENNFTPLNKI